MHPSGNYGELGGGGGVYGCLWWGKCKWGSSGINRGGGLGGHYDQYQHQERDLSNPADA